MAYACPTFGQLNKSVILKKAPFDPSFLLLAGEGRVHKCLWDNKDKISKACQNEERKIQIMQSSNTELMPNLAKACKAERAAHCKSVRPGKSRLYNCLVSNSDSVSSLFPLYKWCFA